MLLQSATAFFITKCDGLSLQSATVFLLQSATGITKCDRTRGVCGGRGRLYTGLSQMDNPFLALVWKRPIKKFDTVSSVFNHSEGLYRTTVYRCLVRRPHYSARLVHFVSRGVGLGMAMFTVASEKNKELLQNIVVYRQCVLQTVTSLRFDTLVFRGHDFMKIANIKPQQEARFSLCKKLVPRQGGGNGA